MNTLIYNIFKLISYKNIKKVISNLDVIKDTLFIFIVIHFENKL